MLTSERPLCGRLSLPESYPQREEGRPARASERREAAALLVLGLLVAAKVETTQEIRLVLTANREFGVCFLNLIIRVVIGTGGQSHVSRTASKRGEADWGRLEINVACKTCCTSE